MVSLTKTIDRSRIKKLMEREVTRYVTERPKSQELFERAKRSLIGGVPMNWMLGWSKSFPAVSGPITMGPPFPVFVKEAKGAYVTDVDDHRYLDLSMGDAGAAFGHSPKATVDAVTDQMKRGMTYLLPTEDSIWVGEELARRFGLPYWQITMTATDSNRFALKIAREITKRNLILVFNGCYHGTVDETLVCLEEGVVRPEPSCLGPLPNPASRTRVIEYNDLDALKRTLSHRDVACVICEPAMTNMGLIRPDRGYNEALREITRRFGTLLIIDETHTLPCTDPGGLTRAWNLEPDIMTFGKPIAGGIPASAMGFSEEVAEKLHALNIMPDGVSGLGGTLSGNALAIAAMRATLEHVMTKSTYDRMINQAEKIDNGMSAIIKAANLSWCVRRLGSRLEVRHQTILPRNATESKAAFDFELDSFINQFFLNRGIMSYPWYNAPLEMVPPQTTSNDVDLNNRVFGECVDKLVG